MVKSLMAPYEFDRRSDHWVKAKKDYIGGMALHDTMVQGEAGGGLVQL